MISNSLIIVPSLSLCTIRGRFLDWHLFQVDWEINQRTVPRLIVAAGVIEVPA